jgi:hypothetical protein
MVDELAIADLKDLLRREVALFCQHDKRKWKSEIWKTVDELKSQNWPAVFFGGTLRSLLISRLARNRFGHPRDVDIVLSGIRLNDIKLQFDKYFSRETRFGGVQLLRNNWQLDLWPLDRTFAFQGTNSEPQFEDLPITTFLNLEAVAIDVWPQTAKGRVIYSGDDQFFKGILSQIIELNNEDNPFPQLCVARSLVIASDLQWKIGPRLLKYIRKHGAALSDQEFEDVQKEHYGSIQLPGAVLTRVKEFLSTVPYSNEEPIELPLPQQLKLWSEDESPCLRFAMLTSASRSYYAKFFDKPTK